MTVHTGQNSLAEQVAACIRRHLAGDEAAFGDLYRLVRPWLAHLAMGCRLTRSSADDVVQSTMERALVKLPNLHDPNAGLAWLSVIARREAIRVSREERRADLLGDRELDTCGDGADPERMALAGLAREARLDVLAQLPERHRTLLTALFLQDRTDYATIATQLGMPVGSIGPTRQRGLKRARAILVAAGHGADAA